MDAPAPGTVEGGYEFIGGDPGDQTSWQPVSNQVGFSGPQGGPPGANYNSIDPEMRAIVAKLPDDRMRQQALEQVLRNRGIPDPHVQGSGRDWYMADPQTGALNALTNTPEWDRYDALEGVMELPRVVAGAAGAAVGSFAGPVGGMAGAAAGGALGDVATRGAMAYLSPEFRGLAEENLGAMAKDVGINAAIDAGTFGIAKGAGPLAGKLFGKPAGQAVGSVVNKGVISPVAKGAGQVLETAGQGTANVARTMQTPFGRSVATMGIPGASEAEVLGELATLPAAAARNLPHGMQRLGSSQTLNELSPELGQWLRSQGQGIRRAASPSNLTEEGLSRLQVNPGAAPRPSPSAGGVLREVAQSGAQRLGASPGTVKTAGQLGNVIGQGAEALAVGGKGLATGARGVAGIGLGAAEAGGRAVQGAGSLLRRAGTLASPFESRAVIQSGLNEGKDQYQEYLDRLRRERSKSNIESILAGN